MLAAATAFGQLSVRNQGGGITINDNSNATPYPSTNLVQGTFGVLEKVTVTLNGVVHGYPDDIDMLLQGPGASPASSVLMSDAGGQFDLTGVTFTLDSTASAALPDEAQISEGGVYKPANYDGSDVDAFPSGTSSTADLGVFTGKTGTEVNGTWNLYVRDDNVVDNGSIGSWTLNLYMSPTLLITNSSPVAVTEDTPATINVSVNDADTPLQNITLSATSSDTSIIPNSGLTFGGNTGGTNRTLTITPKANANGGPVTITVVAKDAQGNVFSGVNQQTFTVNVAAANDAPALVLGGTSVTIPQAGISAPINIQVTDVDNPATDLILTATSSNPSVIAATNVLFTRLSAGTIAGTNRTVQIAAGGATGTATITVIVSDQSGGASSNTITATVIAAPGLVGANATAIQVPDSGAATPYPSVITLPNSAGIGLVGKAVVNLINVEHPNPSDLAVLLVSPSGRSVVLTRGAGDSTAVGLGDTNDIRLTFDRDAANSISGTALTTSTNRPSDLGAAAGQNFPGAAPAGPYSTDLDSLRGSAINGDWKLYVYDTTSDSAAGQIAGGWTLQVISAPTIASIPDQTTPEDTSKTITFQVGDFSGSVTNIGASVVNSADASKVSVSASLSGTTGSVTVTPALNFNTGNPATPIPIMVVVTNNTGGSVAAAGFTATNIFNLTVTPVNDAPTQSVIPKQIALAGQSILPVSFTVGDVETPASDLVVTATSDNSKLLPAGAIVLGGSGANRTIQMFPAGAQGGTATVSVTVTDTGDGVNPPASSTQTFTLTVNAAANALYENTTGIIINDNDHATPYPSIINVSGLQGSVAEVQVTLYGITHPNPEDLDVLLVGPNSTTTGVVLMSDAGGNNPLNSVTLRFRQSTNTSLPDDTQIVSGDYLPSNFDGGDSSEFSGFVTSATLDAFNNLSANGDWKLYVSDDTGSVRGGVISSWQLSIRTHPIFATIPTQTVTEHTSLRVTASLGDNQPGVPYTITTSHSAEPGSTDVIASITPTSGSTVFGGSQTITINPIDEIGSSKQTNKVTVTFKDPSNVDVSQTFDVIFVPVDDAPTFGSISDQTTPTATPKTVNFTVSDPEGTAVTVTATSSRQDIVSDADLANAITPNATTTSSRSLTIVPSGIASGSTIITLTAVDATGQKTSKSFTLNVTQNVSFANQGQITINDHAVATPYPATIDVTGVNGTVSGASVILVGLTHPYPDDVDVLLVAPDGRSVILMSDAGGSNSVNNARLTFASGATAIPDETGTGVHLTSGVYSPANYGAPEVDEMPSPAPAAPAGGYSVDLTSLQGVNPNGQWKLFVRDDTFPDGGVISGGWILLLQTAPTITQIPTQTVPEDTVLRIPFTVSDQDTPVTGLTITRSVDDSAAPGLIDVANVTWVTNNATPPTVDYTLNILPSTNRPAGTQPETNTVTVTVSDGTRSASTSFQVRVTPVDDAPQIAGAFHTGASFSYATNHVVTVEGTTSPAVAHPITLRFDVKDVDSTIGTSSNIVVQSSNTALLPNKTDNIAVSGPDNVAANTPFSVNVTLTPLVNQSGTTVLNFIVSDRSQSVTNQVLVEVLPTNNLPVIAFPGMNASTPETNVIAGGTIANIPVAVSDVESAPEDLILTAFSREADQGLVPNAGIVLGGRGANRTVSLTTVGTATGDAVISVVAQDTAGGKSTNTFTVHVTPPPGSVFSNGGAISIPGTGTAGVASSYPSVISVSGMVGTVSKVTVTIDGLTHAAPDDLDILLVSPDGKKSILMSDAGGVNALSNARLVFDQDGGILPDEGQIATGTYRPADYEPGVDTFPSPAPAGPYIASLQQLVGANPNGSWSLYIVDDAANGVGQIAFGWSLRIETGPTITLNSGLNAPSGSATYVQAAEDTAAPIQFTIADMVTPPNNLNVGFTSSNPDLIDQVVTNWVSVSGNTATINGLIIPVTNGFGTNNLTIVVRRSDGAQSSLTIPMNITATDDLPFISRLSDRSSPADTALTIPVLITDVDTPLNRIRISATSGNESVISSTNILVGGITNNLRGVTANGSSLGSFPPGTLDTWTNFITIIPNTAAFSATPVPITITVQELDANGNDIGGAATTSTFNVTITPVNHTPTITGVSGNPLPSVIAVEAGKTTTNILFTVADPDNNNVTITATSSDQTLVRDADIIIYNSDASSVINGIATAPGARQLRITTQPGVQGDAVITVTVKDPSNASATAQITIRVVPTRELVFSNRTPITIRDANAADPYPSQINVSGFAGVVSKVTVTLNGFQHTFPSDVDMILVSPAGKKSYIMSDAGGGRDTGTYNLRFDDTDPTAIVLPSGTGLQSTTYKVANYDGTGSDDFVNRSPAGPAGPYAEALSTFNGDSPNGLWSLYLVDDTAGDSGAITNGWSIGITTLPVINGLADITSQEDVPVRVPFTIAEEAFVNTGSYSFVATSTNTALVPNGNIVITGSGTNWLATITPNANANNVNAGGPTLITLTEQSTGVSGKFLLSVTPVNDTPTVTPIADVSLAQGSFVIITNFNYTDVETAKKDLTVTVTSSDPNVVPVQNVVLAGTEIHIFSGTQAGTSRITITVADSGDGSNPPASSAVTFNVTVTAGGLNSTVFANNNGITINDNAAGSPYPSTLTVSNINGTIRNVTVTLTGVTHNYPDDVDVLLVGPNGQGVVVMSDAGSGGPGAALNNAWLVFSDDAAQPVPDNSPIQSFSVYKPANYEPGDNEFASPAPAGPYATTFAGAFANINPNGTWSLYVQDDAAPDAGSIAGWSLSFVLNEVGPTLTGLVDTNALEDTLVQVPFTVSDTASPDAVTFATSYSNSNLVSAVKIGGAGADRVVQVTLLPNQNGTSQITVQATDANGTRTRQFTLTVLPVNDAPVLAPIPDQQIMVGQSFVYRLNVSDPDTAVSDLHFLGSADSDTLISDIEFAVSGDTVTMTVTPIPAATGTDQITVSVSDGNNVARQSFKLTIVPQNPTPVLGVIANQEAAQGSVIPIALAVSDQNDAISNLTFTATVTADTNNIIQGVTFNNNGTNVTANVALSQYTFGSATVTVTVSDGVSSTSRTFTVTADHVGIPPVLAPIANQNVAPGTTSVTVNLSVSDQDTRTSNLRLLGAANPGNLVSDIEFSAITNNTAVATISLLPGVTGTETITISVSDGEFVTRQSFTITVGAATPPTLSVAKVGNNLSITVTGTPGAAFVIEGSTDVTGPYTQVGTGNIGSAGASEVQVPISGAHRFFRARLQ